MVSNGFYTIHTIMIVIIMFQWCVIPIIIIIIIYVYDDDQELAGRCSQALCPLSELLSIVHLPSGNTQLQKHG